LPRSGQYSVAVDTWNKTPGGSIAQLTATTIAHWGLLTFAPATRPKPKPPPPMGAAVDTQYLQDRLMDLDKVPF
jgi:hypothetical protein